MNGQIEGRSENKQALVYLSLGSNMGNREEFLRKGRQWIEESIGQLVSASSIYETEAWGKKDQDQFLNQVISIHTNMQAREVLNGLKDIEVRAGRQKRGKWAQRELDVDILFYDDLILREKDLEIPHPLLHERRFILDPLSEISPELFHPLLKMKIEYLSKVCKDPSKTSIHLS